VHLGIAKATDAAIVEKRGHNSKTTDVRIHANLRGFRWFSVRVPNRDSAEAHLIN